MNFSKSSNTIRWVIIIISFVIVSLVLWNTYTFFLIFKNEERVKMQQWSLAQKRINSLEDLNEDMELPYAIIKNASIPIIKTENDSIINTLNVDDEILKDPVRLKSLLKQLKSQNDPIVMEISKGKIHYLYYGDSSLLNKLKYYPLALLLIIVLFSSLIYNFYRSIKIATQNKLWAGMAKETAHQIGTPLSSLIGWLEILKTDNVAEFITTEIEKDIERLQTITERFSKIGSETKLENRDIVEETKQSYDYLISRFSNQIEFVFNAPKKTISVLLNPTLHSWTIENLVKNAIDAMKGRGKLSIDVVEDGHFVKIKVSDSGSGIPRKEFKRIFETGFTTKKRGWGLGLSLTKRIVEEYHNGSIKVLSSEMGKGTTMQMTFRKIEN